MIWYAVYWIATGEADSFGTVIADPLPAGLATRALTDNETVMLLDGTGIWNPATLTIEPRPPEA